MKFLIFCAFFTALAADAPIAWSPALSMRVETIDEVVPSPDGRFAVWTQRRAVMEPERSEFVTQIFLAHADGSARTQLTRGEKSSMAPQFSPDSRFVFFISERSGKKNLFRIGVQGGEAEMLTDWKGVLGGYKISPDGKQLAFSAVEERKDEETRKKEKNDYKLVGDDTGNQALFAMPLEGGMPGKPRKLVDATRHVAWIDWSPDSRRIAYEHHLTASADDNPKSDIAEVDVASGTTAALANTSAAEMHPIYSPDGRYLAYLRRPEKGGEVEGDRIILLSRSGGSVRELPPTFDGRPVLAEWTPDSKTILYSEVKGTGTALYGMPLDGAPKVLLSPERSAIGLMRLSAGGKRLGFPMQTAEEPPEAYLATLSTSAAGRPVRVSEANTGLPKPPLGRTDVVRWKGKDGLEIEGLLTYPVGYRGGARAPLVLNVHGGPSGAFGGTFIGAPGQYPVAAWAAKGIATLRANPRGSTGYGKEFRAKVLQDWGGMDYQDLMAGVDRVIEMGVADPNKLAIMGWSYGGYMTAWTITQTTRFKAAAIGAGITNTVSMYGTQDIPGVFEDYFGGAPWETPVVYAKSSPLQFIANVTTPALIQHGEADPRVPVSQGYEYYRALRKLGVPVKMIVYPRMPHAPIEPKFLLHIMEQHLEWAEKYLS